MISQQTLAEIADRIQQSGMIDESIVTGLRKDFDSLHFTYCSDDDIPNNEPVLESETFNLYLIDGREHCLCLTKDFDTATGVVVAEIYQD